MKLETWDELEEENPTFCSSCGKQVHNPDEINKRICSTCKVTIKPKGLHAECEFFCWACGKQLRGMNEIAQGVCDPCRAAIIRKIR